MEKPLGVESTKIAGLEPSLGVEGLCCCFLIAYITCLNGTIAMQKKSALLANCTTNTE